MIGRDNNGTLRAATSRFAARGRFATPPPSCIGNLRESAGFFTVR
jgi:hypothetical protein